MKTTKTPTNLEFLASQFGEEQWREVIRLLLAMAPASRFDAFMRAVVKAGRLGGRSEYTALCLRDAKQPGEAAFVAALKDPKQRYAALQALDVLRDLNPDAVRRAAGLLVAEPARFFGSGKLSAQERDLAVRLWQQAPLGGAQSAKPTVFLSYVHRDLEAVKRIRQSLEAAGLQVWHDVERVQAGGVISKQIESGIEGALFFVPILTPASLDSRWVEWESNLAWQREIEDGRLRVVPVLLDGDARQLPLRYRAKLFIDLRRDFDGGMQHLLSCLVPTAETPPLRRRARDGSELVLIHGGPCWVGAKDESDNPLRQIEVKDFYLALTPVTNQQYARFLADTKAEEPRAFKNERFNQREQPVVGINWREANAYCDWAGLRLPSEWEWEKGARGTDGRRYPWGNTRPSASRANFGGEVGQPSAVGSYPKGASPYGLLDMAGNVWEWTASEYEDSRGRKTVRGSSFDDDAWSLRSAIRDHARPVVPHVIIGFRCAQDP